MRTWQDNAAEFAALDEGEGWPFARLVACSVEKNIGNGGNPSVTRVTDAGKVSARAFAEAAGTTTPRVLRYLDGWANAAKKRLVRAPSRLTPDDVDTPYPTKPQHSWLDDSKPGKPLRFVDAKAVHVGGRPRDAQPEAAATIIERRGPEAVVEAMTPKQREEMAKAIDTKRLADAVIGVGGNDPALGPEPMPYELHVEAQRIGGVLHGVTSRVNGLRKRAEPDQWDDLVAIIEPDVTRLTRALFGEVTVP